MTAIAIIVCVVALLYAAYEMGRYQAESEERGEGQDFEADLGKDLGDGGLGSGEWLEDRA